MTAGAASASGSRSSTSTCTETGALTAPYPTNIPWPTLVPDGDSWLMVAFNGGPYGGPTARLRHARRLVVMRERR